MTRSRRQLWIWLALVAMLQGCASYEGAPNPAWFPPATTADKSRTPGRVALIVPPPVQTRVSAVGKLLKLQVGAIAEQAMRAALDDGLQSGAQQVYGALPPTGGYSATLVIDSVRFEHQERTVWFVWVPPLSQFVQYEASTTLAFDVSLFDAQGGRVWSRTYDDAGQLVWTTPSADSTPLPKDIGRVAHESAWRLAQRVSRDLREWMDAERMRPRSL
jgi:hypothetical protein